MNILSTKTKQTLAIIALAGITVFFATYKLTEAPAVWFDEGFFEQAAMNLARHEVWGMQIAPGQFASLETLSAGYPIIAPLALVFKIFGIGILQARLLMVVFILGLATVVFLLIKREYNFLVAALATLLLITFPVLYGNGKTVIGEVPGLFYFALYLFFASAFWHTRKNHFLILAGLFLGICAAAKITFLLAGIPSLLIVLILYRRQFKTRATPLLLAGTVFLIPIIIWVLTQFGATDTLQIFYETTFKHYGAGPSSPLFFKNILKFFTEITPLALLAVMSVWAGALLVRLYKKTAIPFGEAHAFFFCLFIIGVFLLSPGWYRYFFAAQIIALWFLPGALLTLLPHRRRIALVAVLVLAAATIQTYQTGFKSFVAEYYSSQRTAQMIQDFSKLDKTKSYFIYNAPEVVMFLPAVQYYQYANSHPQYAPGKNRLPDIAVGIPDRIIIYTPAYTENKNEFARYAPIQTLAGRYILLEKKN